jgi:hypothetical protein
VPTCDRRGMRPESFGEDLSEDWSRWVLAHGLPEIQGPDLAVGESVPVAYWVGPRTAAVLHIRRIVSWDDEEEAMTLSAVHLFCLVDSAWEATGGGGSDWPDERPLRRLDVDPRHATFGGRTGGPGREFGCKALEGVVGTDAAILEVVQAGEVTRRPVEAPIGAIVVCADYAQPFTVRIRDTQGGLLTEVDEPAGFDAPS